MNTRSRLHNSGITLKFRDILDNASPFDLLALVSIGSRLEGCVFLERPLIVPELGVQVVHIPRAALLRRSFAVENRIGDLNINCDKHHGKQQNKIKE